MNNISKTTKTILFASLIAAMILPFSTMGVAEAKEYNVSDILDFRIAEYNILEVQRQTYLYQQDNPELTPTQRGEILAELERIAIRMSVITSDVERLIPLEDEYNPTNTTDRKKRAITDGSTIYVTKSHRSCNDYDVSTTNLFTGKIDTNVDTISWDYAVTDHKSVGWFNPLCTDVYFEELTINVRNNTKKLSCTFMTTNVTGGNIIQSCDCGLSSGDIISWSIQTTYEPLSGSNTSGNDNITGLHRVR